MSEENIAASEPVKQPDTLTITLGKPIDFGAETYFELHLREPTAGEMIEIDGKRGWDANVAVIALVSGVPVGALKKVGAGDIKRASGFIDTFFD